MTTSLPSNAVPDPDQAAGTAAAPPSYTHRQILQILSGLLVAMFVSNVAGTIVGNALPVITAKLGSTQSQYTWIVTATLLSSTASTPIWGKLADLYNKKNLLLIGLGVFIVGSAAAGAAGSTDFLIAARAFQGIGLGAMMALVQAIMGSVIPPRQRGRYMAYTGATVAIATVVGPLVGGFIVDQSWLGWRWCFWSAVPFALIAMAILQLRLQTPTLRRGPAKVDWLGASLVTVAVSDLLIWLSFADKSFPYASWQTAVMLGTTVIATVLFILVEAKAAQPILPLPIICQRTTALAILASIAVGIGMFGSSVFLGQYYQIARGYSPTTAGLMMVPMMAGVLISSVFIGRWVSRLGQWKPFVLAGAIILTVGFGLMATIGHSTPLWLIGLYSAVAGLGLGMTMQNLVLAVQNNVSVRDVGAASAAVTFFRSLGGTIGIQILGTVYANQVTTLTRTRLASLQLPASPASNASDSLSLDLSRLPAPVAAAVRSSYGDAIGLLFLIAAAVCALSIICVVFMRPTKLRNSFNLDNAASGR
ncbi:MAG: MFS transporter [Propionibacteriaceae bacterium]|jgi:EmrB/QacA subfamily drug resistance transporter|nr:MFS transporter [Propionibacteriaceae bacterium]